MKSRTRSLSSDQNRPSWRSSDQNRPSYRTRTHLWILQLNRSKVTTSSNWKSQRNRRISSSRKSPSPARCPLSNSTSSQKTRIFQRSTSLPQRRNLPKYPLRDYSPRKSQTPRSPKKNLKGVLLRKTSNLNLKDSLPWVGTSPKMNLQSKFPPKDLTPLDQLNRLPFFKILKNLPQSCKIHTNNLPSCKIHSSLRPLCKILNGRYSKPQPNL